MLRLIAAGLSNQEIADRLIIAPGTVKRHINNIYGKLGVQSRTQAVARRARGRTAVTPTLDNVPPECAFWPMTLHPQVVYPGSDSHGSAIRQIAASVSEGYGYRYRKEVDHARFSSRKLAVGSSISSGCSPAVPAYCSWAASGTS